VELLGIFSHLNLHELDYDKIVETYDLITFLNEVFNREDCEDDVFLEAIIFLGNILRK
jgi:hypothetical protein